MTCRDRNRLALQNDLLSAHFLGIRNVLCLTGDHVSVGDHKEAKEVYDFESVQLIQCVKQMNEGYDWAGNELDGAHRLLHRRRRHARGRPHRAAEAQVREEDRRRRAVLPDPGRLRHGQLPALHGVRAAVSRKAPTSR